MTLEELQESANRDLKIDDTDLGTESINIPIPVSYTHLTLPTILLV